MGGTCHNSGSRCRPLGRALCSIFSLGVHFGRDGLFRIVLDFHGFCVPQKVRFYGFRAGVGLASVSQQLETKVHFVDGLRQLRAAAVLDGQRQKQVASAGKSCSSRADTSFICENSFSDFRQLQTGQSRCRQKSALCNFNTLPSTYRRNSSHEQQRSKAR